MITSKANYKQRSGRTCRCPILNFIISRFAPNVKKGRDVTAENGKKMGRPTNDPKNHVARLRLSDSEKQKLDECCKLTGLSITEVLKLGIDKVYQETVNK